MNETTARVNRKTHHSKRLKTARKTKPSKRKQFSSDDSSDEFGFGEPSSKRANHQSKIKILENIVLQTADKKLETDYDALRKLPTILESKVNTSNSKCF